MIHRIDRTDIHKFRVVNRFLYDCLKKRLKKTIVFEKNVIDNYVNDR